MQTTLPLKNRDIIYHHVTKPLNYHLETSTLLVSDSNQTNNTITADVTKTFIKKDNSGTLFSVETKNRKQSNLEGNATLENELAWLQQKLVLYCNNHGEITTVVNRQQIKEDWYFHKKEVKKRHKKTIDNIDLILDGAEALLDDENAFIELICKSEIITLLLPPIYDQKLSRKKQLKQHKIFPLFFDDYELPLSIKTTLLDNKEAVNNQIIRLGSIDNNQFKSAEIKRFFRKLYNAQDLAIDIDVAYLETLDLDKNNDIYAATQMMGVEIDSLYRYRQISKLKKIAHV
ncbi:hypothetical protein [Aquimarina sp. MMG016]|uniref:hypothetical protein n=1 Tax=Aquimarina sp. MMG016 TaxID=2822690 RepID=UPI001B3A54E1|nr:hypothetical protein [Aquimarina sp. MMG016]MBQ4820624.1 hypothetical protein [Aquimarina sp. MMG016]